MTKFKPTRVALALSYTLAVALQAVAVPTVFAENQVSETDVQVRVKVGDQFQLHYNERVRLSAVLEQAQQNWGDDIYGPQVRVIMLDRQAEVEAERQQVLRDLHALASRWHRQSQHRKARQIERIAEQVQRWQLGYQPYGVSDLAKARQQLRHNPLLPAGNYQLVLTNRSDTFSVYGVTRQIGQQALQPRQTLRNYLQLHADKNGLIGGGLNGSALSKYADKDMAWRIRPAVAVEELPWGLHNANDDELMPGDVVFIGFDLWQLPWEYRHLRESVPNLLRHFVSDPYAPPVSFAASQALPVPANNHWQRQDLSATSGNYGGTGLMQMPNARFAEQGEVRLAYADMDEYLRYSVSLQVLDWLEATGFYVRVPSRLYSSSPSFSGNTIYTDKGFDLKLRVWPESQYVPQIALGIKDIGGTGLFAAEYLAASKRMGPFDFTLGAGFGRLGTRDHFESPFCTLADTMCSRSSGFSGSGGKFEYSNWFRGPMALFAGVEYQTPWEPLRIKVEYDSNDYSREAARVNMRPHTPINVGLNYRVNQYLDLHAGYERGDTLTFGFSLRTNLNRLTQTKIQPQPVQPGPEPRYSTTGDIRWMNVDRRIARQYAFSSGRYQLRGDDDQQTVTVYTQPLRLRHADELIDRTARVLANDLPESVKTYEIVEQNAFLPMVKTVVDAEAFKAAVANEDPDVQPHETYKLFTRVDTDNRPPFDDEQWAYGPDYRFGTPYGVKPYFTQSFGAPETFHLYQLAVKAFASRQITPNLDLFGEVGVNLFNNFDKFNFTVDAFDHLPVPRVRTYVREYMLNDVWLDTLQATYYERFGRNVYAMAYGGMLERMYGGVGGEILYRPLDKPWSVGFDLNQVWQRDFNGGFGFRDYNQVTGFASLYYHLPWLHDSLLTVRAGQFLAGDKGVNITFQRRFDSGVTVGAWASFTDVSSTDYGEGSFSKGFFLTIPFDLMSVIPSREHLGFSWIPLNRDGGQMLQRRMQLHGLTEPRSPYYNR